MADENDDKNKEGQPGTGNNPPDPDENKGAEEDVKGLKSALEAERKARKAAEKEAKASKKTLEDVQVRLEAIESDGKSEQEKAIEQARKEAEERVRADERGKTNKQLKKAAVISRAAGKLSDPQDAVRLLDLDDFDLDDDGEVDATAVDKAIDELLESKPYLKGSGTPPPPKPSADGGARRSADGPAPDTKKRLEKIQTSTGIR